MIKTADLVLRINDKINGLHVAIECEQIVVRGLQQYREEFEQLGATDKASSHLLARVRQMATSLSEIRKWQQELEDLEALLEAYQMMN